METKTLPKELQVRASEARQHIMQVLLRSPLHSVIMSRLVTRFWCNAGVAKRARLI